MRNRNWMVLAAFASVFSPACGSGSGTDEPGSIGQGGGPPVSIGSGGSAGTAISVGQGGSSSGSAPNASGGFNPADTCAAHSAEGERIPMDLYFMVDTTGSMHCPVPDDPSNPCEVQPSQPFSDVTRWVVERKALTDFVNSSGNAGLGIGIDFFPSSSNSCDAKSYTTPTVAIANLPGAAKQLADAIANQKPAGQTPTVASLTGAIQHASSWAKKTGHRVAVVYSTDGYPKGCDSSNSIANAVAAAKAGFEAKPSVATFVLGMGRNLSSLEQIAVAGGTEHAYLIDTNADAGEKLSQALDSIRGKALSSCTYSVPPPPVGETLDYTKVNVRFESSAGKATDFLQDPSATCKEGWQYTADKSQVTLCGNACELVKNDVNGSVQLQFGCATKIDVPH